MAEEGIVPNKEKIQIILAECALQMIEKQSSKRETAYSETGFLKKYLEAHKKMDERFELVDDMIIDEKRALEFIDSYPALFDFVYI